MVSRVVRSSARANRSDIQGESLNKTLENDDSVEIGKEDMTNEHRGLKNDSGNALQDHDERLKEMEAKMLKLENIEHEIGSVNDTVLALAKQLRDDVTRQNATREEQTSQIQSLSNDIARLNKTVADLSILFHDVISSGRELNRTRSKSLTKAHDEQFNRTLEVIQSKYGEHLNQTIAALEVNFNERLLFQRETIINKINSTVAFIFVMFVLAVVVLTVMIFRLRRRYPFMVTDGEEIEMLR